MNTEFTANAREDFEYWMDHDSEITEKIRLLIISIKQSPFKGLGKPGPLKYNLKGYWSRWITGEHRLVYEVSGVKGKDQKCYILECHFY